MIDVGIKCQFYLQNDLFLFSLPSFSPPPTDFESGPNASDDRYNTLNVSSSFQDIIDCCVSKKERKIRTCRLIFVEYDALMTRMM